MGGSANSILVAPALQIYHILHPRLTSVYIRPSAQQGRITVHSVDFQIDQPHLDVFSLCHQEHDRLPLRLTLSVGCSPPTSLLYLVSL